MRIYAVTMMKDEEDVAEHVIRHLVCSGVDGVIVADNLSTDQTRSKLEAVAHWSAQHYPNTEVLIVDDPEPAYNQWRKMTTLSRIAGKRGATIIIPFDADEIWFPEGFENFGEYFRSRSEEEWIFEATMYNHIATSEDGTSDNPFLNLIYRRAEPWPNKKVAFRFQEDALLDQGNHKVAFPSRAEEAIPTAGGLQIRHFQWRSAEQFLRKVRNGAKAYKLTDLPDTVGSQWRKYGEILDTQGEEAILKIYYDNFFIGEAPNGLLKDPAPIKVA